MILQGLLQVIQVGGLVPGRTAYILVACEVLGFPKGVFFQPARDHAHSYLLGADDLGVQLS